MTNWFAIALGIAPLFVAGTASAQSGMMNGGMGAGDWMGGWMGGYGGYALPVLLVVVVGLLVWVIMQRRK